MNVPFNKPVVFADHVQWIHKAIASGCLAGGGEFGKATEKQLSDFFNTDVLLCSSGTHALEMAALLINTEPGDEVIVPSYTFVSTANAFALRGAVIRFADNDNKGNITLAEIERLYSEKTKAVVVVHYGGHSPDMLAIQNWCSKRKIFLIEDAAQAINAYCNDTPLGTFGQLGCLSFHETKNIGCGEGGALIVNHKPFLQRAEIIRDKGTNRSQFRSGLVDKYTWVDLGSSYVLSELNSAYLQPQVEQLNLITKKRENIWLRYESELGPSLQEKLATWIIPPAHNKPNYHMFAIIWPSSLMRQKFIEYMKERGIIAPFHYVSLHCSPYGEVLATKNNYQITHLPECERLSSCLVRLPLYFNMTEEEQSFVIHAIKSFLLSC